MIKIKIVMEKKMGSVKIKGCRLYKKLLERFSFLKNKPKCKILEMICQFWTKLKIGEGNKTQVGIINL